MTKDELTAAILQCKEKLGRVPTREELRKFANVPRGLLKKHFGSYLQAMAECGLQGHLSGVRVGMKELFLDWARVVRSLGRLPTVHEYTDNSQYSPRPLTQRYKSWRRVPGGMKLFAEEHGMALEWADVMELVDCHERFFDSRKGKPEQPERSLIKPVPIKMERPIYGPLMKPCPLICGPINEAGVIYLFGAMAERMGFVALKVQSAFPDCEALRLVDAERWQHVRIEFEYESRNFLRHMHEVDGCDLIICWKHNWEDCPIEVIALREVARLES